MIIAKITQKIILTFNNIIGLFQLVVTQSTFCKHANSSLLERFVGSNWQSINYQNYVACKFSALYLKSNDFNGCQKIRTIGLRKTTLAR